MAGLTKEQRAERAAKAAEQTVAQEAPKAEGPNVLMEKDGVATEVANNESVAIMQSLGWVLKG